MLNPRPLIHALYTHWEAVEILVRLSQAFTVFTPDQVLNSIAKVSSQPDAKAQATTVLGTLINAGILQPLYRSSDLQLNAYVLEFVRGLMQEHALGLATVLQARVAAIREATEGLNEGVMESDMDRVRGSANKLAELFRQISLQLDQDRHALFELAEKAKSADISMPVTQRYQQILEAFDQYVEPMNQMMDTGLEGIFYRYLEAAEQALDLASERLTIQGALYSHRLQLRQVAYQAKELRYFGRLVAQQCADTILPLREELRQHNALTRAISTLLGQVRKRGLRRALPYATAGVALPLWRKEQGFKLQLGDEVRGIMAAVRHYEPQSVVFPQEMPVEVEYLLEQVDEAGIREHLVRSLPVDCLLDWLQTHYGHLQDATLLRLFHDLQHEWHCEPAALAKTTDLQTIRIQHYPHCVSAIL